MGKVRITAPDTVDTATHLLHRLQAEGWVLETMTHEVDYVELDKGKMRLPVGAVVTVHLVPTVV